MRPEQYARLLTAALSLPVHSGVTKHLLSIVEEIGVDAQVGGLRDHFAGLAMHSFMMGRDIDGDLDRQRTAQEAYAMADAMLKAREAK